MMLVSRRHALLTAAAAATLVGGGDPVEAALPSSTDWPHYANNLASHRYAALDQINAGNFNSLEVAWRFQTSNLGAHPEFQYEATPIVVGGRLYTTAGSRRAVICIDPATGEMRWMYSLDEGERGAHAPRQLSGHGCSYWSDGTGDERIFYVTPGYQLIALNATTGQPVHSFGTAGIVDLKVNDDQEIDPVTGEIGLHATPLVAKNTIVVGAALLASDAPKTRKAIKGYVRGFDAKTGARKWIFHTIPKAGEFGADTWLDPAQADQAGNTGCWAEMSADLDLNLVYLPVELPTGDESGIYRAGPGLFGESIVAVDIDSGQRRWHYQLIHHGLWDRDIPCAPILCDIDHGGKTIKALAQPTKQAFLYVLNRETGKPIWPIPEASQPAGDVPGEWYSPTQPIPSRPPPYDVQNVSPDTIIDFTPELHAKALTLLSKYRTGGVYMPPTLASAGGPFGTMGLPSLQGGTNWPGGCYDPETCRVYVFSQTLAQTLGIVPGDPKVTEFSFVHGAPGIAAGPAKPMGASTGAGAAGGTGEFQHPGVITVDGLPLVKPPYGRITAIDLKAGRIAWQVAHGDTPDYIKRHPALKGLNIPRTGRAGLLGPLVTKSLVICGEAGFNMTSSGVRGAMLRGYDKATGEEKGAAYLAAPQSGSPMTYMHRGIQYIVLAIGGGGHVGELVAYRLPPN